MKLSSPEFSEGGSIPTRFTCDGDDMSPPLEISSIPQNAKSLALIVDDPDAPSGTFTHWVMWNIRPAASKIPAGETAPGAEQGENDFGQTKYGGPCPPSGTHRYFFRLYALDTMLNLPKGSTRAEVQSALKNHVIDEAVLMGRYTRGR
jgi:Raf kinase inhibitor-like YbhB/YbcL family protein